MTENKNVPRIRFAGFNDAWEQRKSKSIFCSLSEKNHSDYPVLSVTQDNGVVFRDDLDIDIKYDIATLANYKVIHPGDFVISLRSFQGGFELSDKLGISSPAYTIINFINPEEFASNYWRYVFKSFKFIQSLKKVTFGIRDGKSISFSEFSSLKLGYPQSKNEQLLIGKIFIDIDNAIASNQRKLDSLKKVKKAMMQKIFDQTWRFEGFTDPWEQRKLISISEINPKSELPNEFAYIDLGSVVSTSLISYRNEQKSTAPSRAQRLGKSGDIFYQMVRPYQKNNYLFEPCELEKRAFVFSTGYAQIRPNGDSKFMLSMLQEDKFVSKVMDRSTGTSYPAINSNDLSNIQVNVPYIHEQQKVGKLFFTLDRTIVSNQAKLDKLKEVKKWLMQNMFV